VVAGGPPLEVFIVHRATVKNTAQPLLMVKEPLFDCPNHGHVPAMKDEKLVIRILYFYFRLRLLFPVSTSPHDARRYERGGASSASKKFHVGMPPSFKSHSIETLVSITWGRS